MATKTKGSGGTAISFHDGNTSKTCIVTAMGEDPAVMAQDMMEVAKQKAEHHSNIPPSVSVHRQPGRIYVTGEGGDTTVVISAMVDAILPQKEAASAALTAVA